MKTWHWILITGILCGIIGYFIYPQFHKPKTIIEYRTIPEIIKASPDTVIVEKATDLKPYQIQISRLEYLNSLKDSTIIAQSKIISNFDKIEVTGDTTIGLKFTSTKKFQLDNWSKIKVSVLAPCIPLKDGIQIEPDINYSQRFNDIELPDLKEKHAMQQSRIAAAGAGMGVSAMMFIEGKDKEGLTTMGITFLYMLLTMD